MCRVLSATIPVSKAAGGGSGPGCFYPSQAEQDPLCSPSQPLALGTQYHHLSRTSYQKALMHRALPCLQLFLRAIHL